MSSQFILKVLFCKLACYVEAEIVVPFIAACGTRVSCGTTSCDALLSVCDMDMDMNASRQCMHARNANSRDYDCCCPAAETTRKKKRQFGVIYASGRAVCTTCV
jgi:hypothetical protein